LKRGRPPCWYYEQGMCTKGADCSFPHQGGMEMAAANMFAAAGQPETLKPACWYYERGCCAKGFACSFRHEGSIPQGPMNLKKLKLEEEEVPLSDPLWTAMKVALEPVESLEPEEELRRLRTKIPQYARSAAQEVEFGHHPITRLVDDYADSLFSALYQNLGDRPWLPQADMLLILDAAVRSLFPPAVLAQVEPPALESLIFAAHDRASDEHRAMVAVWDAVVQTLQGPKIKSRVYKACETARRQVVSDPIAGAEGAEGFTRNWIQRTLAVISQSTGGYVDSILPVESAAQLFNACVTNGALPARCMPEVTRPASGWWAFISAGVASLYASPMSNVAPMGVAGMGYLSMG